MPKDTLAQIEALMSQTTPVDPPLPVPRYLGLLMASAKYWTAHQAPKAGVHPGLDVFKAFTDPHSPELLEAIAELISEAHTNALFPNASPSLELKALTDEASTLYEELDVTLTCVLDDGVEDQHDRALAVAKSRGTTDSTEWTLAQALKDLAAIGKELEPRLSQLGDFERALLDKAAAVGTKLAKLGEAATRASAAIAKRNTLIGVAEETLDELERAARYAFRNTPALLDELPTRAQFARRSRSR